MIKKSNTHNFWVTPDIIDGSGKVKAAALRMLGGCAHSLRGCVSYIFTSSQNWDALLPLGCRGTIRFNLHVHHRVIGLVRFCGHGLVGMLSRMRGRMCICIGICIVLHIHLKTGRFAIAIAAAETVTFVDIERYKQRECTAIQIWIKYTVKVSQLLSFKKCG